MKSIKAKLYRRCYGMFLIFISVAFIGEMSVSARPNQIKMAKKAKEIAIKSKLLKGICAVELIRPDILSITLDGGIVGNLDDNPEKCKALGGPDDLQNPDGFTISSKSDKNYQPGIKPVKVGRASYEWYNCMDSKGRWALVINKIFRHDYFLYLPKPLRSGQKYTITVNKKDSDGIFPNTIDFTYDAAKTSSKTIKINQVGYNFVAGKRYAYLGWWAGSGGPVDYSGFKTFSVVDENGGGKVLEGEIKLRAKGDKNSGEDIYEMDISKLKPGKYHIQIPGFARSETFHVGGQRSFELFYQTMRAFFHQRCGQEFKQPWTRFKKPACHDKVAENGEFVGPGSLSSIYPNNKHSLKYEPKPGEKVRNFKGGYHDASDFDTFTDHLPATSQILGAFEMYPKAFTDKQLNIPESGNGVPDLLDEAEWGLSFYLDHQYENGSVPLGRINLCDALKQNIEGGKKAPMPPFGIIPPRKSSTPVFAAVAAQFARCIRPFDAKKADRYLAAATKAFEYASKHTAEEEWKKFYSKETPILHPDVKHNKKKPGTGQDDWLRQCSWAAGELLKTTGDRKYNEYLVANYKKLPYWYGNGYRLWPYLTCDKKLVDPEIRKYLLDELVANSSFGANKLVSRTQEAGYRMGNGKTTICGWGACQGANHGDILLRAYFLTKDRKYLDAACLNADWHLGANPLSKTLVTNMGYRHPNRPEISYFLYDGTENSDPQGKTVCGLSVYGIGPPLHSYPGRWPLWRSWRDVWDNFAEIYSEFTIAQTTGPVAMLYAVLYALEKEAGTVPDNVKSENPEG